MKKSRVYSIVSYTINLVLLGVIIISNKGIILNKNTITLKDMNESTQIADKEKTIDELNTSQTEYSNYINTSKTNLAKAITNAGVSTSSTDSLETMITNVSKIVSTKTNDATATVDSILSGKTAYVKGSKVTGTMPNIGAVTKSLNRGESYTIPKGYHNGNGKVTVNSVTDSIIYLGEDTTFDVSNYEGFENFTKDNFIVMAANSSNNISKTWYAASASTTVTKSYNNDTGVLNAYMTLNHSGYNKPSIDPDITFSGSVNVKVGVYLVLY